MNHQIYISLKEIKQIRLLILILGTSIGIFLIHI